MQPFADARLLRDAAAVLKQARLSHQWPNARGISATLAAMTHLLDTHPVPLLPSGLPTYASWQRIASDAALAEDGLQRLGDRATLAHKAQTRGLPVDHAQLARADHYQRLRDTGVRAALDAIDVKVRRIDGERTWLRVVLDKLLADGRWVRVTVDVAQRGAGLARIRDDAAEPTEALRGLIFRTAGLGAELIWVALADQPAFEVERVTRGVIGPLRSRLAAWPTAWTAWPRGIVWDGVLETAALDLSGDDHRDPFSAPTPAVQAARATYGFHLARERRFVCTPALQAPLTRWLAEQKVRCVVRSPRRWPPRPG